MAYFVDEEDPSGYLAHLTENSFFKTRGENLIFLHIMHNTPQD